MTPDLTFEDVAGNEHALQEMQELVGYLTNPAKYVGQLKSLYICGYYLVIVLTLIVSYYHYASKWVSFHS